MLLGGQFGVSIERVADLLHVPVDRLERRTLIGQKPGRRPGRTGRPSSGAPALIPLKRTLAPFAGQTLTPAQEEANRKAGGMSPTFYVRQVAM